ncbi:MAG: hypothetical protein WAW88_01290, partial [Nocardioides sp.]
MFAAAAVVAVVLGVLGGGPVWWVIGIFFLALAATYLHTSLRGKFVIWQRLLSEAELPGNAHAVDVGCGRGAVTVLLAEVLTT